MGRTFMLYKFRSMIDNAHALKGQLLDQNERKDAGPLFKMHNDPRITRIGRFLRRTRLDEFPQLYNALRGDISLVGPRPHEPEEVAQYEAHHKKLLVIKSGITGMAQISGASDLPFEEEVKLDTYYIENWSLFLDFKILLRTALTLFRDRSAC
jgi:lipopolysaccharide/colanic/teichoic acid biosynthesis glycosyltransferase